MRDALLHTPEGVRDIYGDELIERNTVTKQILGKFHSYGFKDIQPPTFEYFDIFNMNIGSAPSNQTYKFFDRDNNTLVLRPDFTPGIARCYAKYFRDEELPVRLCYVGNTFMNTLQHQGKLSERTQAGCELINDDTSGADAEVLALIINSIMNTGITAFQLEVGEVEFFKGLMEEAGCNEEEIIRIRELIDKRNFFGLSEYAEKLNIPGSVLEALQNYDSFFGGIEMLDKADKYAVNERSKEALGRLRKVYKAISYYGLEKYIDFDLGLINDYDYYTGITISGYTYGTGNPIVKGGRYNSLLENFDKGVPAVGFAIYIDELMIALRRQDITHEIPSDGVLIIYDSDSQEKAVEFSQTKRDAESSVVLIRKSTRHTVEEYLSYSKRNNIKLMYYFDGDGKMQEFNIE